MAFEVDRFKSIHLTQGGVDAFVEGSISTGIVPEDGLALLILGVEVKLYAGSISALAADGSLVWSLARDTKTAVGSYDDDEIIMTDGIAYSLTTSGAVLSRVSFDWQPPAGLLVVEPNIYVQFDSTATGVANDILMRVHYQQVKVSELEILRLLNNQ